MKIDFAPIGKSNLSNDLADRIVEMIQSGVYGPGDRLPAIMQMARSFGVGHPTLREALKKLESVGVVEIKHGSGVYVGTGQNSLLVQNPAFKTTSSKKLMLDLVEARSAIEVQAARMAAEKADDASLARMKEYLDISGANLNDDSVLNANNMAFHHEIAEASGNAVFAQLQELLASLFQREQKAILYIYGSRAKDHAEHRRILEAIGRHDADLSERLMQEHLEGVRATLLAWNGGEHEA